MAEVRTNTEIDKGEAAHATAAKRLLAKGIKGFEDKRRLKKNDSHETRVLYRLAKKLIITPDGTLSDGTLEELVAEAIRDDLKLEGTPPWDPFELPTHPKPIWKRDLGF